MSTSLQCCSTRTGKYLELNVREYPDIEEGVANAEKKWSVTFLAKENWPFHKVKCML